MLDLSRLTNVGEALRDGLLTYQTNTALIEVDRQREKSRMTYRDLREAAEGLCGAIQTGAGLQAADRCAILMSNQSRWIVAGLAGFWAGAVLVPLDYKLTPKEQLALLAHCQPRVLVTEYPVWRALLKENLRALERTWVIVTEAPDRADIGPAHRFETLQPGAFNLTPRLREDVACIVYSSGTSGDPKGCMLTHGNYLAQAESLGRMYPMREQDRYFSILPTNHAIDFMCGFLLPLMFGGAIVHQRTLRPEFLMPTMRDHGITHMALVPRILKALQTKIEEQLDAKPRWQRDMVGALARVNELATRRGPNHSVSSTLLRPIHDKFGGKLRLIFAGGAFVERENAEYFYRLGLPVVIGYGLTEAGTVLTVNDLKPFRSDTVGVPVAGTEVVLRRGSAAAQDEGVGEVWVRGPTVMKGYYQAPELTADVLVDGWLRTGDLGTFDAAGHLKLVGRAKNMVVTAGGKNVYPEELENAFVELRDVEEYCVFSANYVWPTGKLIDEQLVLVLRPKPSATVDDAFLERVRRCNLSLREYKRVQAILVCEDEFPRTASQKIKREALAKWLGEEKSREVSLLAL